jgi:hypothetical protein
MASITELQMRQLTQWADSRVPERLRDEIRVECRRRGSSVTVFEVRGPSPFMPEGSEQAMAQLRLGDDGLWSLYWHRANGRWLELRDRPHTKTLAPMLREIDDNPDGVFWG